MHRFYPTNPEEYRPIAEEGQGDQSLSNPGLAVMSSKQLSISVWGAYIYIKICSLRVNA